jgi:hypothetical protein
MRALSERCISCCLPESVGIVKTSILVEFVRLEQGPSAVRDSPPPTASKRNRENPAPLPTVSKDRRVKLARR